MTWNSLQRMSMSLQWSLCVCIYHRNTTADMDQWCVWVCREHGPACTEYQRACNDPCVTASIRTRELETSTNDVLAKDQFLSSQVLKWHCIIDVIRSETKANDLTDFLGEQWEHPKKPGDDYFCFVSRIKISDSPCHLKTIIKLWKVRLTFKFNPAENYIEKVKNWKQIKFNTWVLWIHPTPCIGWSLVSAMMIGLHRYWYRFIRVSAKVSSVGSNTWSTFTATLCCLTFRFSFPFVSERFVTGSWHFHNLI